MKHRHTSIDRRTACWMYCITPQACAANPSRQGAHGGVTHRDTCECGATREVESNYGHTNRGPWKVKP